MVSCDVTGGTTFGTKLKMPILTLLLTPYLTKSAFGISKVYIITWNYNRNRNNMKENSFIKVY